MSGQTIVTHHGPKTFRAEEPIVGGQIVAPGDDDGVKVAAADADVILGVALLDAAPKTEPVEGILVAKPTHTAVAYGPAEVWLETTATLSFGAQVGVAAGGKGKAHTEGAVVGTVVNKPEGNRALVRLS